MLGGAVTGDIHPEDKHLLKGPLAHPLTMAVCVANFFFVTTVLMNLLIAMLSQTYDEISRDARESWKLHRAAILIKIDRAVSPARRASDVFWQTTPSDNGARRQLPTLPYFLQVYCLQCQRLKQGYGAAGRCVWEILLWFKGGEEGGARVVARGNLNDRGHVQVAVSEVK